MSDPRHRHRLTEAELSNVKTAIDGGSFVDAIVAVYSTFGVDLTDESAEPVQPTHYAIPTDQWHVICQWLSGRKQPGRIAQANAALDWVNVGPSSYEDDD
jgi:hypothetical protein